MCTHQVLLFMALTARLRNISTCMYIYEHICTCTYVYTYIPETIGYALVYMYACIYIYTYIYIYIHTHIYTWVKEVMWTVLD